MTTLSHFGRPNHGLQSNMIGLQFSRLASQLKPWLRTNDGLWWLMATAYTYKPKN